jgi:hypothetical protein
MKKTILVLSVALVCCGKSIKQTQQPIHQSTYDIVYDKLESLSPYLITCDGGITDDLLNPASGRPLCDTGDSIMPIGLVSTVQYNSSFDEYVEASIGDDGRPYRSPEHKKYCETNPSKDTDSSCNFSRDHLLGHMLYAIGTHNTNHISRVVNYIQDHDGKVCPGNFSQCGITPAVWDVLGDTLGYLGLPKPIQARIPDPVTITADLITVATTNEFQLSLVANVIYIKLLTNNLNSNYNSVTNKLVEKAQYNTFFRFLQNKTITHNSSINNELATELVNYIDAWKTRKKQQSVWFWSWNEIENANAWSFIFMGNLLLKEGIE